MSATPSDDPTDASRATIEAFWATLYERDWDKLATFFADDAQYTDIGTPADDLAVGPDAILKRLRLGLEPITGYEHDLKLMVAEGERVATEHTETWTWHTGETVPLQFMSIHELRDGKIVRWWDYWDLTTLLSAAPAWWIERIMVGYT